MPSYNYHAINELGRSVRGIIIADNENDLETRLKEIKLDLVSVKKQREKRSIGGSIRIKHLIVLCMHLEQLDRAGVPLHDALADVRDASESPRMRDVLTGVYEAVKNGSSLSKALGAYPKIFNEVFTGLVAAGENTGNLSDSFTHLADHLKWTADIQRKVKKATRYPIVLLLVISGVVTTMMLFVVPKLIDFLLSQGLELPVYTRALIWVSGAFEAYWYLILGTPVAFIFLVFFLYRRTEWWRYRIDVMLLRTPLIGPVIRKIDMSRFCQFFSVMFNSGVDILDSLEGAKGVVHNQVLKEAVDMVKNSITEGSTMTESLRLSNQFPSLVVRMFKVGEESGNIKEALENINFFYTREVNDSVEAMVGAIQPILTVVMGSIIFWVIASVFGPLYDSFSKTKF